MPLFLIKLENDNKELDLKETEGKVTGRYNSNDNGRIIEGRLVGKELEAYWLENSSGKSIV
ncbi:MAG: hypothetical protein GY749_11990 [Desulfobacteraceae bacterium]|nr:hypothetical protein [Desulfobacteraceae bacterium]